MTIVEGEGAGRESARAKERDLPRWGRTKAEPDRFCPEPSCLWWRYRAGTVTRQYWQDTSARRKEDVERAVGGIIGAGAGYESGAAARTWRRLL